MFTAELLKRRKLLADFGRVLLHAHPDDDGNVPQPCGFDQTQILQPQGTAAMPASTAASVTMGSHFVFDVA
jgi:hypothetical protein